MKPSDECYTPEVWLRAARDVLGSIDLDPCTCASAQQLVRAAEIFTVDDDGLAKPWRGRLWFNPPYSECTRWAVRLLEQYQVGNVTAAIALLPARTDSKWFRSLSGSAWRCEVDKRIRFYGPAALGGTGRMGSCVFYLGPNPARFVAVFSAFGRIVPPPGSVTADVTGRARACVVCGRSLAGLRADTDTCSSRCRQRRYRLRCKPSPTFTPPRVSKLGTCGNCGLSTNYDDPPEMQHRGVHCGNCNAPVFGDPAACSKCGQSFGADASSVAGVDLREGARARRRQVGKR